MTKQRLSDAEIGVGWRALRGLPTQRRFDVHAARLAPRSVEGDGSACAIDDARIVAALSSYPGSMDDLIGYGAAAPATWLELVRDERIYDLLFIENATHAQAEATFAFVSLQLDPQCGDTRLTFRTEHGLVGPVER